MARKTPAKRKGTTPRKPSKAKWDSRSTASFRKTRAKHRKKSGEPSGPTRDTGQSRGKGKWGPSAEGTPGRTCGYESRTVCRTKKGRYKKGRSAKSCSTERIYVCRRSDGTFAGVGRR